MNILQHLPENKHGLVLVTLNPPFAPDPSKVVATFEYEHPMMTNQSVSTQSLLPGIQNTRGVSYVGAWTKYGFHEDGFSSAFKLLINGPFNVKPPFPLKPASRTIGPPTRLEKVGRSVVGGIEKARRGVESTGIWVVFGWAMVLVLLVSEKLGSLAGYERLGRESKRLRAVWGQQKVKLQ